MTGKPLLLSHTFASPPVPKPLSQRQEALASHYLNQYWGYQQFRSPQREIVQALLQGKDLLAVLPTGSGKSLCFQLPALCRPGLTLVVSPLIALMENQVADLQNRGIAAASLHSQLQPAQHRHILHKLHRLKLLYLAPETLLSPRIWQPLQQANLTIAGLMVDEAHCLSQWGDSFRPAYDRLGPVRQALLKAKPSGCHFPVAAFTATADAATRQNICSSLRLQTPAQFRRSLHRPNIALKVQRVWTPRQRRQKAIAFIRTQIQPSKRDTPRPNTPRPNTPQGMSSGLVYVRSRRHSEALVQQFTAAGFHTAAYHAGLTAQHRRQIEQSWLLGSSQGGLPFVVCTSAFGLGVDLPSCRWVLHYHLPTGLAEYVQEVGRAGRDGQPAIALALASEPSGWLDPSDRQRDQHFHQALVTQQKRCLSLAQKLPHTSHIDCIRTTDPQIGLLTLAMLHRLGRLEWIDPFQYRMTSGSAARSSQPQVPLQQNSKQMQRFLGTKINRWNYLCSLFD